MPDNSFDDDDDLVYAGSFVFCREHGCEFCNECFCDHRLTNNVQIMDELQAAFPSYSEAQFMDRPTISYVYDKGVERTPRKLLGSLKCECKKHHVLDCSTCFDWAAVAVEKIKLQAKQKNSKVIPIDISREEKVDFLRSMGLDLSPATRLPQDALEKKFRNAIDACQSFATLIPKLPFDPSTLPVWSKQTCKKPLLEVVNRGNIREAYATLQAKMQGKFSAWDLYENVFMDIRQTIMTLGNNIDNGRKTTIIQDQESKCAICMRVVDVRMLNEDTPVMIVLYRRGARDSPSFDTVKWVQEVMMTQQPLGGQIRATPEEQKLLLAVLNANARRLSPDYSVKRHSSGTEAPFALSFLLPIGPINQRDMGNLTHHTGCVVCGQKTRSKCSRCLAMEYCGAECQRAHWKEHKPTCNSLQGGEWIELVFSMNTPEMRSVAAQGGEMAFWNSMASGRAKDILNYKPLETEPAFPPNLHAQNPFLIKIQRGMHPGLPPMMIYDRTRTFQVFLCHETDSNGYGKTAAQMHTGQSGLKIYRWAKRTGENRLSVCLNRAPPKDPLW
ncbi:hypothetical protein FB446DRAFT_681134 [Lentinula raphanica]|nr:hypothetical protein FB446DRAFT_681134 [Lentinula raphanica]